MSGGGGRSLASLLLVTAVLGATGSASSAPDCRCPTAPVVVLPPEKLADGTAFRAPVNTHVWIIGQHARCDTPPRHSLHGPQGPVAVTHRPGARSFAAPGPRAPLRYVDELVPPSLEPDTVYEIVQESGGRRARIGSFTTGVRRDEVAPASSGPAELRFLPPKTDCGLGQPDATLRLDARDDVTPPDLPLLGLRTIPHGAAPGRTSMWIVTVGEAQRLRGGDLCHAESFVLPAPLEAAKVVVRPVDLSGNLGAPRSLDVSGPHTAASARLLERTRTMAARRGVSWGLLIASAIAAACGFALALALRWLLRRTRRATESSAERTSDGPGTTDRPGC